MSAPLPADKAYRFNPPPNWPTPPPGWTPPQGWAPPPSWPPPPHGWQFWVETLPTISTQQDTRAAGPAGPAPGVAASRSRAMLRWAIIGGTVVVGLVIANVTGGMLGHVFALIVWAAAACLCIRPARAPTASAARMWARIGVAAFACLAVYAGSLAIVGTSAPGHPAGQPRQIRPVGLTQDGPLDVGCKMTGTPGYSSYGGVVALWNPGSSPQSLSEFAIDWGSNGVLLSQEPVDVSAEIAPGTAYRETVSAPASATSCVLAGWNP